MNCSCGPMCQRTNSFVEFVQQPGACNLVVEAQWGMVALVLLCLMFAVIVIESITIIGYGCYLCYVRRRSRKKYHLVQKPAKSM